MASLEQILRQVEAYQPDADLDPIRRAHDFVAGLFGDKRRPNGEPYLEHLTAVGFLLAELHLDIASIVTGLLHNVLDEEAVSQEELAERFGPDIASMVEGATKIGRMAFRTSEKRQAESFRKMLLAMARDIRVIMVKLADRLHNMRTLERMPKESQRRISQETMDIFAPLANRLGISWVKSELEDLAFRYIYPDAYADLAEKVEKKKTERKRFISEVKRILTDLLAANQLEGQVSGRLKHLYSVYRKMERQGIQFDQVFDLIAFRIIVPTVRDCYGVLGIVHANWTPIPGRFKDYIAMPKANLYQSLHTSVIGRKGERMEIQIRTEEMHRIAEEGIAAHWKYKEGGSVPAADQSDSRFRWLRQMLEWQRDLEDSKEFLSSVKVDLFPDEVYVFTPGGDVKELPQGATPVDFAYAIHSDVGQHCSGAKVNGKMVPLRTELKNGDIIEVLTTASQSPSKDWLKFVRTSKARNKIRGWVKAEQRERSIELGRDLLEKKLRKYGASLKKTITTDLFDEAVHEFGFSGSDDLIAAIGYGKLSPGQVVSKVLPKEVIGKAEEKPSGIGKVLEKIKPKPSAAIKIAGVDDILVRFAKCCNPLPGDKVTGFITRGRGVTVHTIDCQHVQESDPDRRIDVAWDRAKKASHRVKIRIFCSDQKGMLASLSTAITGAEANIVSAKVFSTKEQQGVNYFEIDVMDLAHLTRVTNGLQKIKGVYRVERLRN
ncbi:MAG: GTP pyrophosphokinase [Desulfuromonas sp.]|nr:MAG: GTP pyrophosphokinase [Desulfuromonas sp.]